MTAPLTCLRLAGVLGLPLLAGCGPEIDWFIADFAPPAAVLDSEISQRGYRVHLCWDAVGASERDGPNFASLDFVAWTDARVGEVTMRVDDQDLVLAETPGFPIKVDWHADDVFDGCSEGVSVRFVAEGTDGPVVIDWEILAEARSRPEEGVEYFAPMLSVDEL